MLASIGLPVYNGGALLAEALDSLLAQQCDDFELVISDNASTDETEAICRAYAARDPRVVYHRAEVNQGASWNFNRVFELSRGEFFMWAGHDDRWAPSCLGRCIEALRHDPEAVLCHSVGQPFLRDGRPLGDPYVGYVADQASADARWRTVMHDWRLHSAVYGVMRRAAAAQTRLMAPVLCADFIFVAEMALLGKIIQVPDVLQWKRVPEPDEDYHTPASMLAYMSGRRRRRGPRLQRLMVTRELLHSIQRLRPAGTTSRRLAWAALAAYIAENYWLIDLKEYAWTWAPLRSNG